MHHLLEEYFRPALRTIDRRLPETAPEDVPRLLAPLPLSAWGLLTLDVPDEFPNLRRFIPQMPPEELQLRWVGASGTVLLMQSVAFVEALAHAYARHCRRPLPGARVLDYGCGWGRHLRLLARFVPVTRLHGVDPSAEILDLARRLGVRARLAHIPAQSDSLPFPGRFDVIYAFSVLTHLSAAAHRAALALWSRCLEPGGLLAVTIRPRAYWTLQPDRPGLDGLLADHDRHGFAFVGAPAGQGGPDYGDASISVDYIRRNWTGWRIAGIDAALADQHQTVVFLRPA